MSLRLNLGRAALLSLLVALAGCATPKLAADGWQTVAPENGGFSAEFPGKPSATTTRPEADDVTHLWMYTNTERKYLVLASTSDYTFTPSNADAELKLDQKNFVEGAKGKALSSKRGQTLGADGKMLPSLDFTFVTGSGWKGESRVIMDGSTIYMTVVMWDKDTNASDVSKRFFASYKLLPRTRPAAPADTYTWQTVAPENAGFSADFPGTPRLTTKVMDNQATYIWMVRDPAQKFLVMGSTSDYYFPPLGIPEELKRDRETFLQGVHGSATSSKRGHTPGADGHMLSSLVFTFKTDFGWKGKSKVIVDGQTVYMNVVMWRKDVDASDVRKRFFDSYKLLPRTRPPLPQKADADGGEGK